MSQINPTVSIVTIYTKFEDIFVRQSKGRYTNLRWLCVWLTQLTFYGLPWMSWNQRQAVLFDLATRKFYLFGIVLFPQDFIYLAVLLIICAYSLFLFTTISGRVWCGFSCPQTVYTEIFMWVENKIEGSRSNRMRLAKQAMTTEKFLKRFFKHTVWLIIALWTGFSFVGYFMPIKTLGTELVTLTIGPWSVFWMLFYSLATYGNAGFMREQMCRYLCPYARFQGSMLDKDSLIVSYDKARGEPRRHMKVNSESDTGGACIDCTMCVQVCPTGIDIRNGLQHDCIGCAACIDACDSVMDKIGASRGLVRFTTENALLNQLSVSEIRKNLLRPRVVIYSLILCVIVSVFFNSLNTRVPLKMNVLRDRNNAIREVEHGAVENIYRLHIMNADELPHQYKITATGIDQIEVIHHEELTLNPTESRTFPITVRIPQGKGLHGANKIYFELSATDNARIHLTEETSFMTPR